jgi:hypothetical protein
LIILFNIATRQRPDQFEQLLQNIKEMVTDSRFIIVAKLDSDDPTRSAYEYAFGNYREFADVLSIKWGESYNKVHAINRDIPENGWDILVNVSDDQRFTLKGFDDIIRKEAEGKPCAFLHFPDEYKRAACSTMSIMTRQYYIETGKRVYHEDYMSLWCDVEATEVAKLKRCYYCIPTVIARHDHYSTTGRKMDALYKRNNTYQRDQGVYNTRKARDFDMTCGSGAPNILIKYPTRGRWRLFAEALENIHSTIQTHKFQIQVTGDIDDPEMNSNEVKDLCKRYPHVNLVLDNHESKIHACNNHMPAGDFDMIVLMSDDMRFTEQYWDVKMWQQIRSVWPEGTDYFAHFNDGYVGDRLPTMNICGQEWYNRFGYLYHPSYKSVSCDAENMYVAMMMGKHCYFPEVYFKHLHPAHLKQPSDYIYRRNHAYGEEDTRNYFTRLKRYFGVKDPVMIPEEMKPYL